MGVEFGSHGGTSPFELSSNSVPCHDGIGCSTDVHLFLKTNFKKATPPPHAHTWVMTPAVTGVNETNMNSTVPFINRVTITVL